MDWSRIRYIELNEKSNSFFNSIVKENLEKQTLVKLNYNNSEISDQKEILTQIEGFYKKLYSTKYESIDQYNQSVDIEAFRELPKLTEEDKNAMENDITLAELSKSLNEFQNNKSPGCDGLTKEFYQCFWKN